MNCNLSERVYGTLMTILGVILLCPDTLLLREVQGAENWTVTFYRHLFIAIAMMICQTIADRNLQATYNSVWSLGYLGIFSGIVLGTSMLLFTIAVQNTAAANVLVINATNPIFSAIFSYLILGEFIDKKTFVVMLICFGAIILVFSTEFGNDAGVSAVAGNLCALGAAVTVGLYFVLIRLASIRNAEISMIQCNMLGGIVTSLAGLAIGGGLYPVTGRDMGFLVAQGIGMCFSFSLLTIGPSYITAPEVSLYTLIETVVGPALVYAGGFETPPIYSVYGGVMLFVALAGHSILSLQEDTSVSKEPVNGDNDPQETCQGNDGVMNSTSPTPSSPDRSKSSEDGKPLQYV